MLYWHNHHENGQAHSRLDPITTNLNQGKFLLNSPVDRSMFQEMKSFLHHIEQIQLHNMLEYIKPQLPQKIVKLKREEQSSNKKINYGDQCTGTWVCSLISGLILQET